MRYLIFGLFLLTLVSCQPDKTTSTTTLHVALQANPETLHPLYVRSAYARQVADKLHITGINFDPESLEFTPLLLTDVPIATKLTDGPLAGMYVYDLTIRPNARWTDGAPITAKDYLTTLKAALNPIIPPTSFGAIFKSFEDAYLHQTDANKLTIILPKYELAGQAYIAGFEVMQASKIDPTGTLAGYSFKSLQNKESWQKMGAMKDSLAISMTSPSLQHETITTNGSGPYVLDEWQTDQFIRVIKKENYWGKDIHPLLATGPDTIVYHIIADDVAISGAMKEHRLDIVTGLPVSVFKELKENSLTKSSFDYYTPDLYEYYFIPLNNDDPKLADKRVRRALAHCVNVPELIQDLAEGLGEKIVGPVHPTKPYYDHDLPPIPFDIEKAVALLADAGWTDTNNDGVVDKMINGQHTELVLELFTVPKLELSEQVALIFQQNAEKAGVKIVVTPNPNLREVLNTRKYQMMALRIRQSPFKDDFYLSWHTDNNRPGGRNLTGFGNEHSDSLIMAIRETEDLAHQNDLYQQFQALVYEEQPAIFLYAPKERLAISTNWNAFLSNNRPGFVDNAFTPKK